MTVSMPISLVPIAPMLFLALSAVAVLLFVSLFKKSGKEAGYLAFGCTVLTFFPVFKLIQDNVSVSLLDGAVIVDRFALVFSLIFLAVAALTILSSIPIVEKDGHSLGEYYVLVLCATLGMMMMAGTENLLTLFLGLEILSISLYVLAGFVRDREKSVEAALKYFLLGAFATAFILYGMALLYGVTRSLELRGIARAFAMPAGMPVDARAMMGMGLMLIGLVFKVGAAPFHFWIPDVYQGSPTPVAGFMAAGTKAAALASLLRVFCIGFQGPQVTASWTAIITFLAIVTMCVGNVVALAQTNIKRMLAYSSIAHAGYLLVGVVVTSSSSNRAEALSAIVYYLAGYIFMNLGAFGVASVIGKETAEGEEGYSLYAYSGLARRRPVLAAVMAAFMLSLTGIPPMAGFLGKFFLFRVAVDGRFYLLAAIGLLNSVIGACYYLRVIVHMYMKESTDSTPGPTLTAAEGLSLTFAAVATILLGILPVWFLNLTRTLL